MPGNPGERQPEGRANKTRLKPVEFQEYNGWSNFPSWSAYTVMTSDFETYQALQRIADQGTPLAVKDFVIKTVQSWKEDKFTPHKEAARMLAQDFLMNGIRKVEWTPVYDTLRGKRRKVGEANELTTLAYDLLSKTDWKPIVAEAAYFFQADDLLRGWVEDQCLTWLASPDARAHSGSVGKFATTVLDMYFQAVQWEEVTDALREK